MRMTMTSRKVRWWMILLPWLSTTLRILCQPAEKQRYQAAYAGHTYVAQLWKMPTKRHLRHGRTGGYQSVRLSVVFTGTSLQLGTAGGDSSVQNSDLRIPETNAGQNRSSRTQATTAFRVWPVDQVQEQIIRTYVARGRRFSVRFS